MSDSLQVDWQVSVAPTVEPVTLNDLRSMQAGSWLRVDFQDDDAVLQLLISQCRAKAETISGKALALQTIQAMFTLPMVNAGTLSGASTTYDQNFYQYNESLGANPFSPAPFVLKMPMPPLVSVSLFEYRTTAFNPWQTWPATNGSVANYVADSIPVPGVVYLQYPPAAYQYRLTYAAGYAVIPPDLKLALMQLIAWKYENRVGETPPSEIVDAFVSRKTWVL
jgi:hypothetical protein